MILNENLDEFKTWYTKQIEKRVYTFADKAVGDYFDAMLQPTTDFTGGDDPNDFMNWQMPSSPTQHVSLQQTAYNKVDQLNELIFNTSMNSIKQMMTIAIMETQALLDRIDV